VSTADPQSLEVLGLDAATLTRRFGAQVLLVWAAELLLARWTSDRQAALDLVLSLAGLTLSGLLPFALSLLFAKPWLRRSFASLALAAPLAVVLVGILAAPAMAQRPLYGPISSLLTLVLVAAIYLGIGLFRRRLAGPGLVVALLLPWSLLAWFWTGDRFPPLAIWGPLLLAWAVCACLASRPRLWPTLALIGALALLPNRGVTVTWATELPQAAADAPDIVLLCLDTLRTDAAREMETVRRLEQDGVTFQAVQAAGPWTLPSMATVMTAVPPWWHGAGTGPDWVPLGIAPDTPTFAALAEEHGYDTAALVHNPVLAPEMGFARGFQVWDSASVRTRWSLPHTRNTLEARPFVAHLLSLANLLGRRPFQSADELADRAIEVLEQERHRPLLLWVHMLDCHFPYRNAEQLDFPRKRRMQLERGDSDAFLADPFWATDDGRATLLSAYHHEIKAADQAFLRILDALGPVPDNGRVVVFFSDHGEEFFEHESIEHGQSFYQELLDIPMIIQGLPGREAGSQENMVVSHLDLGATLMHLIGVDTVAGPDGEEPLPGRDLAQALAPRPITSENLLHSAAVWNSEWAVRVGYWKYIFGPEQQLQVYDLSQDPGEQRNLADSKRADAMALPPRPLRVPHERLQGGAGLQRSLNALGYTEDQAN